MWPLAALAPRRVTQCITQAIHHHLGDCSWMTMPGYTADLVCIVMHLHAHIASYSYTYVHHVLLGQVMSFLSQYGSAEVKQAFCPIVYFAIEKGLSAAPSADS